MDEFKDALEGKISKDTVAGWPAEKLVDYHKFLTETVDTTKGEVGGLREAKRVEIERVTKAKTDADAEEARLAKIKDGTVDPIVPPKSPEMTQFRQEQVKKAKDRLYATVTLTEEEKAKVEENFTRLDTGKIDSDLIYTDLLSAVAASNPDQYLTLSQRQAKQEEDARAEIERQAAAGEAPPAGQERKKFSDEVMKYASDNNITPEAAQKQLSSGMRRTYG